MKSLVYRNITSYHLIMRLIYGNGFFSRYENIASLIPAGSTVLEVCCGDCYLYKHYLIGKRVRYTGVDINESFLASARKAGIDVLEHDLRSPGELPRAEYVIVQGSMYHFLPDALESIFEKLLRAATKQLIVVEPTKTLSNSSNWLIRSMSKYLANPGTGHATRRFTPETFEAFCQGHSGLLRNLFETAHGRETCAVFEKSTAYEASAPAA